MKNVSACRHGHVFSCSCRFFVGWYVSSYYAVSTDITFIIIVASQVRFRRGCFLIYFVSFSSTHSCGPHLLFRDVFVIIVIISLEFFFFAVHNRIHRLQCGCISSVASAIPGVSGFSTAQDEEAAVTADGSFPIRTIELEPMKGH